MRRASRQVQGLGCRFSGVGLRLGAWGMCDAETNETCPDANRRACFRSRRVPPFTDLRGLGGSFSRCARRTGSPSGMSSARTASSPALFKWVRCKWAPCDTMSWQRSALLQGWTSLYTRMMALPEVFASEARMCAGCHSGDVDHSRRLIRYVGGWYRGVEGRTGAGL